MFESHRDPRATAAAVDAITLATREENAAGARRLAAIGELYALRAPDDDVEKQHWVIDGFTGLVVEVAAALGTSRCRARAQVERAVTLRERLPRVAAIYAQGLVDAVLIGMIVSRTDLIIDDDVAHQVDAELAAKMVRWGRLSKPKMEQRIDAIIGRIDEEAVHGPRPVSQARYLDFRASGPGAASVRGALDAATAAVVDAALDRLAREVCRDDPRSHDERRAAALKALVTGGRLRCECGLRHCAAAEAEPTTGLGVNAVVHVITTPEQGTGYLPGYGQIPAEQVEKLAAGATVREVQTPPDAVEPRYRPSAKLAEFVRCRDLTCRFPDCDRPAEGCDIDHTVPYPAGPTHPSNLKCLCRFHHLLKTFHGWTDHQYPDGTVAWTAPTGHTYVTKPEGAHWFPALGDPTGTPKVTEAPHAEPGRGRCMPTRTRTRVQERRDRVYTERYRNYLRIDEEAWEQQLATEHDPAPF